MKKITLFISFFLIFSFAKATHNRAGEILYKRIAPFTSIVGGVTVNVYTYSITVIKYTNDGLGVADRCVDTVYFGDGSKGIAPRINGATTCGCGSMNSIPIGCGVLIVNTASYKVKYNVYSIIHTYPAAGTYLVRSSDPNRNQGIHNIPNSVSLPFYIESQIKISLFMGPNASPVLTDPPVGQGVVGTCFYANCGAYDADGDSLSYELSSARGQNGGTVLGYFLPETGTNGNFSIDAVTGLLTWCTPQFIDEYSIVIIVKEWRRISCNQPYSLIGYVLRDMEVSIKTGPTAALTSSPIADTCVSAGAVVLKRTIVNTGLAQYNLYGGTATFSSSPASINGVGSAGTRTLTYQWNTLCSQARKQPYDIQLVYTPFSGAMEKFYRQFRVTVLPPTPYLYAPVIDTGEVTLTWASLYSCLPNLAGYNIYRKTGVNNWTHSPCEPGVSANSGFILVGVASATTSTFKDNRIWPILNGTTGHYVVTAFTNDCAESFADNALTLTLVVGLDEEALGAKFKIYPNPFNDKLEIDLGENSFVQWETCIYSIEGKEVYKEESKNVNGKLRLPLSNLKCGIYMLTIKTESGVVHKKIVKN